MSNSFDLSPNCLQRLSADHTSAESNRYVQLSCSANCLIVFARNLMYFYNLSLHKDIENAR